MSFDVTSLFADSRPSGAARAALPVTDGLPVWLIRIILELQLRHPEVDALALRADLPVLVRTRTGWKPQEGCDPCDIGATARDIAPDIAVGELRCFRVADSELVIAVRQLQAGPELIIHLD